MWWNLSSREEVTFVYFKSIGMSQGTMKGMKIMDIDEDKCIYRSDCYKVGWILSVNNTRK